MKAKIGVFLLYLVLLAALITSYVVGQRLQQSRLNNEGASHERTWIVYR